MAAAPPVDCVITGISGGALGTLGLALPPKRITVNLAPADLLKEGSHFDLPVALAPQAPWATLGRDRDVAGLMPACFRGGGQFALRWARYFGVSAQRPWWPSRAARSAIS